MSLVRRTVATALGVGLVPFAPGTFGSLATLPLVLLLWWSGRPLLFLPAVLAVTALGLWSTRRAEQDFGTPDPGAVVIDEVAGMLLAAAALPAGWLSLSMAFVAFRLFDVAKPWPVGRVERWPGAWGIMADDLLAGAMAQVTVRLLLWALERLG
ncbi:MAG: phosphatidylglycerophosphatase A [Acidobacteriota bacterium]|nr:phosphatidylglycerophosphatase A [Acidobacteriota bacterium]MDQ7088085.1 phosphatidylglycerophosphatase A [Acidobacteriota bacterium]